MPASILEGKNLKSNNQPSKKRTIEEINTKIRKGDIQVLPVSEFKKLVDSKGIQVAFNEIDVVTTGTFGAMCSSGALINVGHSDPPIKIQHAWINDVPITHPGAAVDLFIGATIGSETKGFEYGGGYVIEDLVKGDEVELRATAYGTDCYPRTEVETTITKDDLNQFILLNFRNGYQRYSCAVNGRDEIIYTYMGKLLPKYRNATYSGAGEIAPLSNDPNYETIGLGTKIFLGGGQGYVIGEGTQHSPSTGYGTLMVKGNAKQMNSNYLRGATFTGYGSSIYIGLGIPIPLLNIELAEKAAIRDEDILTDVIDYGVPRRGRPTLRKVSYKELKSGKLNLNNKEIKVSSISSLEKAESICRELASWIQQGNFTLTLPVERLSQEGQAKPMRQTKGGAAFVDSILQKAVTCEETEAIETVAKRLITKNVNHIVVVDTNYKLTGIVTSWDITKAIANGVKTLKEIIVTRVYTASSNEPLEVVAKRLTQHNISALPVIDGTQKVLGIITSEDIAKLVGGNING
ncbi:CBS domain-containing protein [Candidatus Bathyarchaeota archaeon]|nr:CBS domain-containing protein [Candidatus Bathyarchaeota archaeon]